MNEFLVPTLSAIVATLVATALIYASGVLTKRVKENPERYTEEIARVTATAMAAIAVAAFFGAGWLVHHVLEWCLDWAGRVAANPGTAFDEVPDAVGDVLFGASWPWQYTCAAFLLFAPWNATELVVDRARQGASSSYLVYTVMRGVLAVLALLVCAGAVAAAIGAHLAIDDALESAYTLEPAYFPGLTQAWTLPWGLHWTTLTGAAAAVAGIQYFGFLVYMKLDSMAP